MAASGSSGGGSVPTVSITTPAPNTTVSGMVSTTASASSSSSTIASVAFQVAGGLLCTATAPPYACGWNSGNYAHRNPAVSATARDAAGDATSADDTSPSTH